MAQTVHSVPPHDDSDDEDDDDDDDDNDDDDGDYDEDNDDDDENEDDDDDDDLVCSKALCQSKNSPSSPTSHFSEDHHHS